jgi:hypothetical protein
MSKSLKRKMRECRGILIAPSKLLRFSSFVEILAVLLSLTGCTNVGFGPDIRGTDGKADVS